MLAPVLQASTTTSILDLAHLMSKNQSDCVGITARDSDDSPLVVMVLTKDVIQLQALEQDLAHLSADAIMSTPLLWFAPTQSMLAAYWEMQQQQVQRLVVSEDGRTPLGMVKNCLELHSGEIQVESEVGKGTTFTVKLLSSCPVPN